MGYIAYIVIIMVLLINNFSGFIAPLTTPMTLIFGIYVWKWQEGQKNQTAEKNEKIKKCKERAEKVFHTYIKYERSIQKIHRLYESIGEKGDHQERIKFTSQVMDKLGKEILNYNSLYDDIYYEILLSYFLIEKDGTQNVYEKSVSMTNIFKDYKYYVQQISPLLDIHDENPLNKQLTLTLEKTRLHKRIKHLDFGYEEDKSKVIYTKPRQAIKKFCEEIESAF
ncbi:hypothetical protein [Acinetobacter pollinis]|nr:hypothetical protein [Acinetobacter pollinis]MBF7690693.1 hypothetical protein [Acinetobacter pollinis]MBF7698583.1 hypothetical protein [Acinetobacter pollinis]